MAGMHSDQTVRDASKSRWLCRLHLRTQRKAERQLFSGGSGVPVDRIFQKTNSSGET